jgi:hypothetical protein
VAPPGHLLLLLLPLPPLLLSKAMAVSFHHSVLQLPLRPLQLQAWMFS